ncbi:hypothetical protein [Rhizorhapis suberifaciens]|uniref:Uncharacterized protein n=1 Tax=Rhizorhapis suberifaciens TaxID=13656 RepID=A0A840HYD5_9SPHN|nr:hypothetical protein [Rhizorhapis suberifaciens]MBB4643003.1 hypothetical protein [Rhizorhapis suberifaciens]
MATASLRDIRHFIGGQAVASASGRFGDLFDPNIGRAREKR